MERRLSAIVAADVVGYSRLMEQNEADTFQRLRAHRKELFEPEIEKHHGRIFKLMGDGLLAEFASVVDAVECAVSLQRGMAERNSGVAEDRRIDMRIGINLGDVIIEDADRHGDGVNIAARLQHLAEPGGIAVSRMVMESVKNKLAFGFESLGDHQVKNIAEPVSVHRVLLSPKVNSGIVGRTKAILGSWRRPALGASLIALAVALGVAGWLRPWESMFERNRLLQPDRTSIAVLPFTNMSGDPEQEYFADGMTEDLITDLSKISELFVIARNSSFAYKGKDVPVSQVAMELGVGYVLEGSVRRNGDKVRINAQLIDASTGGHLWADRYDGSVAEVFALQDQVTRQIVVALALELTNREEKQLVQKDTDVPQAYDAFLQGWEHYRRTTPEDFAKAIPYLEEAVALDPNYGRARAALALVYYDSADVSWNEILGLSWEQAMTKARQHLDEALKYPTSTAYLLKADMLRVSGKFDEAIAELERAIALDASDSLSYANMANALISVGRPNEGLDYVSAAMRIDPHYPPAYLYYMGKAQFGLERFEEAAASLERATKRAPDSQWWYIFLAAAYGHLGRESEAKDTVEKADAGFGKAGQSPLTILLASHFSYENRADLERLLDGLRKAKVPELPFGYDGRPQDRLAGDEIRAITFGRTHRGRDPQTGEQYSTSWTKDGIATSVGSWGSDANGTTLLEGDRMCILWPRGGRECWAIFRNPNPTAAQENEFIRVYPSSEWPFSLVD